MSHQRAQRLTTAVLVALLGLILAGSAFAQTPSRRLAVDLDWRRHGGGKKVEAQSFARRVATHLVPMLEGLGYEVTRVHSAKKAIKGGDYHFAVSIKIDAKPVWLVHEARQHEKVVVHDSERGVSGWGAWELFGYQGRQQFASGEIGPIDSRVHDLPGGRPEIDDEEAVARVFAGEVADRIGELMRDYAEPEVLEYLEDE